MTRDPYEEIGVTPIINGDTTRTRLGGSIMPAEVLDAMRLASQRFVVMEELQQAVGAEIARLTRNEAAMVAGGAAAGLVLAVAACRTRNDATGILPIDGEQPALDEVVVQASHWNPYAPTLALAGVKIVKVGAGDVVTLEDLRRGIGSRTAAVAFFAGARFGRNGLTLKDVVKESHARNVPVIVDAASELPPPENLWLFTQEGADLVVFSGGKGLSGPASTGLVLGRREYIERCVVNASPLRPRVGRPMKVSKEDLIGVLAAVKRYLQLDHNALSQRDEAIIARVIQWAEHRSDLTAQRMLPGEAGQPIPMALIRVAAEDVKLLDLLHHLEAGDPRIFLCPEGDDGFWINPHVLRDGDLEAITSALDAAIRALSHVGTH